MTKASFAITILYIEFEHGEIFSCSKLLEGDVLFLEKLLISACLMGIHCRYNGERKAIPEIDALMKKYDLIPVCPEQLGGLKTPREPSEISGEKVLTKSGSDVTAEYIRGAEETLRLGKLLGAKKALLKAKSPSCGSGTIHDGSFSGKLKDGYGITAKLLSENGFEIYDETKAGDLL